LRWPWEVLWSVLLLWMSWLVLLLWLWLLSLWLLLLLLALLLLLYRPEGPGELGRGWSEGRARV